MSEGPSGPGTLFEASDGPVADLEKDEEAGWLTIVAVEQLEHACAAARSLGAEVVSPPQETGGFGRYAVIADPSGARIGLFQPAG